MALLEVSRKQNSMESKHIQPDTTAEKIPASIAGYQKKENAQDIVSMSILLLWTDKGDGDYGEVLGIADSVVGLAYQKVKYLNSIETIKGRYRES